MILTDRGLLHSPKERKEWWSWSVYAIVIASFGPYVLPSFGLRVEHLVIYPTLFLMIFPYLVKSHSLRLPYPISGILFWLLGITVWTLVSTQANECSIFSGHTLAALENYIQPIAIILIVSFVLTKESSNRVSELLKHCCQVYIILLSINAIVALISIFADLSNLIVFFTVGNNPDAAWVWKNSADLGRYCGIFNQPVENGISYSFGLLSWAYLARVHHEESILHYSLLVGLLLGGTLAISKVFLLGGFPLFLLYWNPFGKMWRRTNKRWFFLLMAMSLLIGWFLEQSWNGWDRFIEYFNRLGTQDDYLQYYTAGRFGGSDSFMNRAFSDVWLQSPICGFGFGTAEILDNGYLEFFLQGGIPALIGYFWILCLMIRFGVRALSQRVEEGRLLLAFSIIVIGAGFGAPVLTINRASTVFWVLFTLACFIASNALQTRKLCKAQSMDSFAYVSRPLNSATSLRRR